MKNIFGRVVFFGSVIALGCCGTPTATTPEGVPASGDNTSAGSGDSSNSETNSGTDNPSQSDDSTPSDTTQPDNDDTNDTNDTNDTSDDNQTPDELIEIDPNASGPYGVMVEDSVSVPGASGRSAEVRMCAPGVADGSEVAEGRFPLMLTFPGFQLNRNQYYSYCEFFASWGFVTFATTYSEGGFNMNHEHLAEDVPAMIDWATSSGQSIARSIDPNAIGVGGHSLGGKIALMAASLDSRIGVVVAWDPVEGQGASVIPDGVQAIEAPLLLMGETLDSTGLFQACAPSDGNYARFYESAPNIALEVTVNGADHMDWVDDPSCFVCTLCRNGDLEHGDVKALTRRTSLAFARRFLLGDESMDRYLTGAVMNADEQSGLVTIQSKGL